MPLAIPMVWREQKNDYDDCYFCLIDITGFSSKNKHTIVYPDLENKKTAMTIKIQEKFRKMPNER